MKEKSATRILMLNNEFPPLGGGTGSVNLALFEEFAKLPGQIEIDLITSNIGATYQTEEFSSNITIYKVPVRNKNIHHSSSRELIEYAVRAFLLALWLGPKKYHSCLAWCTVPAGAIALLLKCFFGLPYLVRVSGPDLPGFEARYEKTVKLLLPLLKTIWRKSRSVIAKCNEEVEILKTYIPEEHIQIIPNGVDTKKFNPANHIPNTDGVCRILSVGRLIPRKRHHLVLKALAELKNEGIKFHFTLVGDGDIREELEKLIDQLELRENVTIAGYVPREKIPCFYQAADVFVLASEFEGMSVATLEAIASGLPVIVNENSGLSDIINDFSCGLISFSNDHDALKTNLRKLISDKSVSESYISKAKNIASSLGWGQSVTAYYNLFSL